MRSIMFLLLVGLVPRAHAQDVTEKVDRFTGVREITYSSKNKVAMGVPNLTVGARITDGTEVLNITFLVASLSNHNGSSWKYVRCHSVNWLVDSQPLPIGATQHDGLVQRGGVIEIIQQQVSLDQLRTIGSGNLVEFQICNDEYVMSANDVHGIAEVAARVGGEAPPATTPAAPPESTMKYRPPRQ